MFDVSFFELLVIGVVALVVIGPERLPGAIKTCALWIGRMKRILAESRSEFEKHIGADEIRRELHNEEVMASLEKLKASRAALELDLLNYQNTLQAELNALEHSVVHNDNHNEAAQTDSDQTAEHAPSISPVALEKPTNSNPSEQFAGSAAESAPLPPSLNTQDTNTKHD